MEMIKTTAKTKEKNDRTNEDGLNEILWSFTLKITNLSIIVINLYYEIFKPKTRPLIQR